MKKRSGKQGEGPKEFKLNNSFAACLFVPVPGNVFVQFVDGYLLVFD